jgi:hypothetical protein
LIYKHSILLYNDTFRPTIKNNSLKSYILLDVLLDFFLQLDWVCADNLLDFFSVFEDQKGWHCANSVLLSEFREFVDIDFEVIGIWILLGEFNDLGGNDLYVSTVYKHIATPYCRAMMGKSEETYLTGTTPGSVEIDDTDA